MIESPPNGGKGSKKRIENFKSVQSNWDLINWGKVFCRSCGLEIDKIKLNSNPELYIKYPNGKFEHKNCDFN